MSKKVLLFITIVFLLLINKTFATSIIFEGQQCANNLDLSDTSSNGIPITSKFTVTDDRGDGIYGLVLTGGYPRISSVDDSVCIDTFLGHAS
jgi:hypothetical protein